MTVARDTASAEYRRIAALALPALVVLAAEPLYVLVDTAVVGHLGRVPLAALGMAGTVLGLAVWLGNVLAYGTTGRAARRFGAGDRAGAVQEGVQASWLAVLAGLGLVAAAQVFAGPLTRALSGNGPESADVAALAESWLRVASLGAPFILLAMAGNGWMRGVQDTRRPLRYVLGANLASAVLCPLLVYTLGWGMVGSAWANVAAQTASGGLFLRALIVERVPLAPRWDVLRRQVSVNANLLVRGAAFQACFLSAAAVAARFGAAALAAHQIALQLWFFSALVLDSVAIAAQSLVGAELGAGDAPAAKRTARRIAWLGGWCGVAFAVVLGAGVAVLPALFVDDPAVWEQAALIWPWFLVLLPLGGIVFALDGVLIGAGDVAYLRNLTIIAAVAGFLPLTWLAYYLQLGLPGVWAGLTMFLVVRLVALLLRMRTGGWAVPSPGPVPASP
ncbi:MATE family efflux transporter [Catellatospora methionotrophica]|uniref:MATE family efflux transporter n=1 Tax=Catellatospora methionotrophica TaxID=121620 RepID=A0A8J3LBL8_9ACTN|nr:MATE family efflux transporter [Catellatospora methionotrophica]GIG17937.1 MATE family efflux transporter [Catellatospora methionotrophica]